LQTASSPPRFALAGLSMGGYIALEIVHQAPRRVVKLALLDTSLHAETAEQSEHRRPVIEAAQTVRFAEVPERLLPVFVHRARNGDEALKGLARTMAAETGPQAFLRRLRAIIGRQERGPGGPRLRAQRSSLSATAMN
jgi:pimeloyl-ACP methyl ester carboxylesterase